MNWDQMQGRWTELKGQVKSKWGKLTDDDLTMLDGKRETLVGKLVQRYGNTKEQVERELDQWLTTIDQPGRSPGQTRSQSPQQR